MTRKVDERKINFVKAKAIKDGIRIHPATIKDHIGLTALRMRWTCSTISTSSPKRKH